MERARPGVARTHRERWAAVGRSAHADPATAGREAARLALAGTADAGLLLLFASGAHDLAAVAGGVAEIARDVPVAGCSTAGEITADGPSDGSVVALALGGSGMTFSTTVVQDASPRDAGARAAACLGDVVDRPHHVLMLLADGPAAGHAEIARGAYSVSGAGVPLVGGVAAHPERDRSGRQVLVHGGEVVRGAVVGVAIGSDAPLGVAARHGWVPQGEPMLVTRADGGRIFELDDRPAAEVYRECLGTEPDDATVLAHPFGVQRRVGEAAVRTISLDGGEDGSIECAVASGALVWLMSAAPEGVLDAADQATTEAVAALRGADPQALIVFGCAARARFLGWIDGDAGREVERIAARAGGAVVAGAYTDGEFARTRGIAGYHHQTAVVLAVA